jgi:hypothetical protein
MAVTAPTEGPGAWLLACRTTTVVGAAAWGAAGMAQALEFDEVVSTLQLAALGLALAGWAAEAVVSGLAVPVVAGLVAVPALLVVAAGVATGSTEPTDESIVRAQTLAMVALVSPFLAAAARSLGFQATSTWHVGVAGATLALAGGAAVAAVGALDPAAVSLLTLAGVLLVAYSASDRQNLGELLGARSVRYGAGSLVLTALFGATAVGAYAVARRNDHTFDWTRTGTYTLSDQTRRVVSELPYDVEIQAFFRARSPVRAPFEDLIGRMQEVGPRLNVTWIDPLANPIAAKEALVTGDHGVVILKANGRERRLEGEIREEELTRDLLLLGSDQDHVICWVQGHGEPDPDQDEPPEGFGGIRTELEGLNYEVLPVRTAQERFPASCEVVVLARPAIDPLPFEREALAAWVAAGGKALVMVDLYSREGVLFDVPELVDDLQRYGVHVGEDVLFDLNEKHRMLGSEDPTMVVLSGPDFTPHPITRSFGAALVMPGSRSVGFVPTEGLAGVELLHTSRDAWGETTPEAPEADRGTELVGEVPVMVVVEVQDPAALHVLSRGPDPAPTPESPAPPAGESGSEGGRPTEPAAPVDPARGVPKEFAPAPGGRLVVIGDTDFASNRYVGLGNNRDLVLNVLAWLVAEDKQLGERPQTGEPLEITDAGSSVLCLFSVGIVPGTALLVAAGVLLRRRSL